MSPRADSTPSTASSSDGITKRRANTLRSIRWYHRRRAELVEQLGGRCDVCGSTAELQLDHPHGRDWPKLPAAYSRWRRLTLYLRDAAAGNLRLLCATHNHSDGARRKNAIWAKLYTAHVAAQLDQEAVS